jgi:hypothetical protein
VRHHDDVVRVEQIRVGGTSGGMKLLFGEWAEIGEDMLSLKMLVCTNCRPGGIPSSGLT